MDYKFKLEQRDQDLVAAHRHTESKIEALERRVRQLETIIARSGLSEHTGSSLEKSRGRRSFEDDLRSN